VAAHRSFDLPQIVVAVQNPLHRVNLVPDNYAGVHPLLPDFRRTRHPLSLSRSGVQDLHPIGGAGPGVGGAAIGDVDLVVEDTGGGELAGDANGGAREPAVEAVIQELDVEGGGRGEGTSLMQPPRT